MIIRGAKVYTEEGIFKEKKSVYRAKILQRPAKTEKQ